MFFESIFSKVARLKSSRKTLTTLSGTLALALAGLTLLPAARSAETATQTPLPLQDEKPGSTQTETAVFAGGCFWGVQGVFEHVKGVKQVASGYTGGAAKTAQYEEVGTGKTGHAESVQISYDPHLVSYGKLLQIFFSVVQDPTTLNYQGPDHGTQYRSAIFPVNAEQKEIARAYISQLDKAHIFPAAIVTSIEDNKHFYTAENYHQNFLVLHPDYPYIVVNDMPKVENLKRLFPTIYRDDPVLLANVG